MDAVRRIGLQEWIDRQLHPERIPDAALDPRLAPLPTLRLSTAEILRGYDPPPALKKEIQKRRAEMGESASDEDLRRARRELAAEYKDQMAGPPRKVVEELQQAKLLRAVYSERQLDEVLVDFWMNHFNVFAGKGQDRFLVTEYERDVIRPHAWGRFEDLLRATAQSPAMLFYLDNWLSTDPNANVGGGRGRLMRRPAGAAKRKAGLNENYAREIMELHTLGVDGGYTQKDVTEVARCLTGWTIRGLRQNDPRFVFLDAVHDHGDKVVLGHRIEPGGIKEGEEVIHLLATHPATARFISYKLARRFVADEPPAALVDRAAATFRKTDGDIREVVRTIVTSPEFFAPEHRQAKVKTPFEFVVSCPARLRGRGARTRACWPSAWPQMGMPLYLQQPPTGLQGHRRGLGLDERPARPAQLRPRPGRRPRARGQGAGLRPGRRASSCPPASPSRRARRWRAAEQGLDPARMAGLILGSPEFQRR